MHQSTARRGNTRAAHLTRSSPRSLEDPVPRRAHLSCSSALQEAISSGTPGPPTPLEWSRDPCHHRPRVARPPHQPGVLLSLSSCSRGAGNSGKQENNIQEPDSRSSAGSRLAHLLASDWCECVCQSARVYVWVTTGRELTF